MTPKVVATASLNSIIPLLPARPTHLAVDSAGTTYWVQESTDARDTVFSLGPGDVPVATGVSTGAILRAMGVGDPSASGTIQSLCAGFDDSVYFYFAGGTRREPVHAIGRFRGVNGTVEIVVGTDALARETGFGASIDLVRASLFASTVDRTLWAWVRHTDGSVLLQVRLNGPGDVGSKPGETRLNRGGPGTLVRPFPAVRTDDDEEFPLVRPEYQLSAAPDGSVVMIDTWLGAVWRIDPTTGRARILRSLVGLPGVVSAPMFDPAGDLLLLFGDAPILDARVEAMIAEAPVRTTFPALVVFQNQTDKRIKSPWAKWTGDVRAIAADDLRFPPGLDRKDFKPREADAEVGMKSWVVYDAASGALLRLRGEAGGE